MTEELRPGLHAVDAAIEKRIWDLIMVPDDLLAGAYYESGWLAWKHRKRIDELRRLQAVIASLATRG